MKEIEFINLHLQLSEDDVENIDQLKVVLGMRSRSEVIRHLIREFNSQKGSVLKEKKNNDIADFNSSEKKRKENIEDMIRKMVKQEVEKKLKK